MTSDTNRSSSTKKQSQIQAEWGWAEEHFRKTTTIHEKTGYLCERVWTICAKFQGKIRCTIARLLLGQKSRTSTGWSARHEQSVPIFLIRISLGAFFRPPPTGVWCPADRGARANRCEVQKRPTERKVENSAVLKQLFYIGHLSHHWSIFSGAETLWSWASSPSTATWRFVGVLRGHWFNFFQCLPRPELVYLGRPFSDNRNTFACNTVTRIRFRLFSPFPFLAYLRLYESCWDSAGRHCNFPILKVIKTRWKRKESEQTEMRSLTLQVHSGKEEVFVSQFSPADATVDEFWFG